MRDVRRYATILLLCCLTPLPLSAFAADGLPTKIGVSKPNNQPKQRVYVRCESLAEADVIALRKHLMEQGAERVNLFFSEVLTFDLSVTLDPSEIIGDPRVGYVLDPAITASPSSPDRLERVKNYYQEAEMLASGEVPLVSPSDFTDKVFINPPEVIEKSRLRAVEGSAGQFTVDRAVDENAEFLIGNILIRLVYPESDGFINSENWSDAELRDANQGAVTAALAFQTTFNYVDMNYVFTADQRVQTDFEPIKHNSSDDAMTWIPDVMSELGYPTLHETAVQVNNYNNDGRKRFGTDWVYTAFIANSENEPGNIFSGGAGGAGYTAYANLGGPYLVMPFPAGAVNPNQLTQVRLFSQIFQHEMVHIFWGLDEYPSAPSDCNSHSGYLDYSNRNKQSALPTGEIGGCPTYVNCLMWNARAATEDGRPICFFTRGQIGVVDANNDGIPDIFSNPPRVEFEGALVETVTTPDLVLHMKVISQAVQNRNPLRTSNPISYAPPLKDATINIDGIGETQVKPDDGRWNEIEEDITFSLSGLPAGLTRIRISARNEYGAKSEDIEKQIYFIGLKFTLFDFRLQRDEIEVSWQTVGETFGAKIDLYRVDGSSAVAEPQLIHVDAQPENPGELFQQFLYEDSDIKPGSKYQYFVVGGFSLDYQGQSQYFETKSTLFDVQAMLPMKQNERISHVAPNPFRESTTISIDIPRSYATSGVDDGPGGGFRREVATEIKINVYDVRGRRVKSVFDGRLFSRIESFTWDGTNESNVRVPSGIYFIKATAGPVAEVRKVVIVR